MTASRVLLRDANVVTCSGDLTERAFAGDILVEGDRIVDVFRGRAPVEDGWADHRPSHPPSTGRTMPLT